MKGSIWKFPLKSVGETWLRIPSACRFLTAQVQDGALVAWALVDPQAKPIQVHIHVTGTGWEFNDDGWRYLSTVQIGGYVWHVFVPEEL